jgi:four helix bundle protein
VAPCSRVGGKSYIAVLQDFPKHEVYGLSNQLRRSAVSIPSNIADGKGRFSQKELVQFLFRARGSLLELETQIIVANKLGYIVLCELTSLPA